MSTERGSEAPIAAPQDKRMADADVEALYDAFGTPSHVIAHCRAVCRVALRIAEALNRRGASFDLGLIRGAALCHDAARVEEAHGARAAEALRARGYAAEAAIVEVHMFHDFPAAGAQADQVTEGCGTPDASADGPMRGAAREGGASHAPAEDIPGGVPDASGASHAPAEDLPGGAPDASGMAHAPGAGTSTAQCSMSATPEDRLLAALTETDMVCLGDRLVREDRYVGLDARFQYIMDKSPDTQEARDSLIGYRENMRAVLRAMEARIGLSTDALMVGDRLDPLLRQVEKPGRYIGGEMGSIVKAPETGMTRFAFCFPDLYEIGMSYLGLQILYKILNDCENVSCERAFAPAADMEKLLRQEGLPLYTLESKTPLSLMDFVGFTLQYEMSYTEVLSMLDLAGIPLLRAEREAAPGRRQVKGGTANGEDDRIGAADRAVRGDDGGTDGAVDKAAGGDTRTGGVDCAGSVDGRQDGADGTACYTDGPDGADGGACDPADEWRWPLVVAGGPCACNPEPLADFIDMFFIGDGEELLPQVMRLYREARQKGWSRQTFYRQACRLPGVYIPALYAVDYHEDGTVRKFCKLVEEAPLPVRRAIAEDLAAQTFPTDPVVPLVAAVHDRSVVEIFRGCTRGCRFCQAGMIYRPVRERPATQIISLAMEQLENTGNDELSLLSLSSSDHTQFEPLALGLMEQCSARHVALSLPSLRVDRSTVHVLERMQSFKKSGLTYAPEAGTQRLRDVINKGVTEADIFSSLSEAVALGWRHVKLYFMIGLPTESQEDLDGIADLAGRIAALSRSFHVNVSVSNFVPKPHTPFQWVGQDSAQTFAEKHAYLHQRLTKVKGVTFRYHDSKTSLYEAVLARGDRRLGEVLLRAYRLGCRLDSWSEHFRADLWERAFAESGLTTDFYATRTRAMGEVLPWDLIDCGVSKSFLMEEMEKAQSAVTTPDCRTGGCTGCGVRRFATCPAARVKEAD